MSSSEHRDLLPDAVKGILKKADLILHSEDLFGKNGLILIQHGNDWYQLKKTKHNRLILNK